MKEFTCPGLPASWVNGWLAAVGATVLSPDLRLRWTTGGTPCAVLWAREGDPVSVLADSWPSRAWLDNIPIAKNAGGLRDMTRKVPLDVFVERAKRARGRPDAWTLSSTVTDLHVDDEGFVEHAPFDPPAPKGSVMHDRLLRIHSEPSPARLRQTLEGVGERIKSNGLAFDIARMGSAADNASKWVDPVVETLAFFGLALLPVRGRGTDARAGRSVRSSTLQRGWVREDDRRAPPRFVWPAWSAPLDHRAIDALLDVWRTNKPATWSSLGIHAAWRSVSFQRKSKSDTTRGYGSERVPRRDPDRRQGRGREYRPHGRM